MALVPVTTFGQLMAGAPQFGAFGTPFANTEERRDTIAGGLQNTALGVAGRLQETELAGQFGLRETQMLTEAQKKVAKMNADASGRSSDSARRAALLGIAAQGLGGAFRPAGQAIGVDLSGGLGTGVGQNLANFNAVVGQLQGAQRLANGFNAGSAGQTQRALLSFPRPTLLS